MKKEFKKGDKVKRKDGKEFSNGKAINTISEIETNGMVWFIGNRIPMANRYLVKIEELFKVGDKVKIKEFRWDGTEFAISQIIVNKSFEKEYFLLAKNGDFIGKEIKSNNGRKITGDKLEKIGKNSNVEKNHREVIRDIKCGETWRSKFKVITCDDNGNISVSDTSFEMKTRTMLFNLETLYTKDKEQITFEEAIKLYKTGSIIESALTGNTYQNVTTDGKEYIKVKVEEILNGWYLYE